MTDPLEFGLQLLDTGDLDPVYIALHYASLNGLGSGQLQRLCIAYWCYYHLGVAAQVSTATGGLFWHSLRCGLATLPRGTERRHFRGAKAVAAVEAMAKRFPQPESLVAYLVTGEEAPPRLEEARGAPPGPFPGVDNPPALSTQPRGSRGAPRGVRIRTSKPIAFGTVRDRVLTLPLFGPWIAFKVADMLERVLALPIDFTDCSLLKFYSEPRAGAELAGEFWDLPPELALFKLYDKLRAKQRKAPPRFDRFCNIQETETILCKYKSHLKGHYPIGKDILEVAHGLEQLPNSPLIKKLLCGLETGTALLTLRRKPLVAVSE